MQPSLPRNRNDKTRPETLHRSRYTNAGDTVLTRHWWIATIITPTCFILYRCGVLLARCWIQPRYRRSWSRDPLSPLQIYTGLNRYWLRPNNYFLTYIFFITRNYHHSSVGVGDKSFFIIFLIWEDVFYKGSPIVHELTSVHWGKKKKH